MTSWPPLALAVWLGVSSASLAAEPRPAGHAPAPARAELATGRHLSLDLPTRAVGVDGPAAMVQADAADLLAPPDDEHPSQWLELHLGRDRQAGRMPGDPPSLYGELGIDLDPGARLAIVPSYRVVVDQTDRPYSGTIDAQVLKLGARIRF